MVQNNLLIVLGNQLFPLEELKKYNFNHVLMIEDYDLCTYVKHHKSKILMFLTSMREYRDSLLSLDKTVHYIELTENKKSYFDNVTDVIRKNKIEKLYFFEPADKAFKEKLYAFLENNNLDYEELHNPMFILQKGEFEDLMDGKRLFMADFYKKMRKKLNILMNEDKPVGGKWSFDEENRKKLPKGLSVPKIPKIKDSIYKEEIKNIILENFSNHPGELDGVKYPLQQKRSKKMVEIFFRGKVYTFWRL